MSNLQEFIDRFTREYPNWVIKDPNEEQETGYFKFKMRVVSPNGNEYLIPQPPSKWPRDTLRDDPKEKEKEDDRRITKYLEGEGFEVIDCNVIKIQQDGVSKKYVSFRNPLTNEITTRVKSILLKNISNPKQVSSAEAYTQELIKFLSNEHPDWKILRLNVPGKETGFGKTGLELLSPNGNSYILRRHIDRLRTSQVWDDPKEIQKNQDLKIKEYFEKRNIEVLDFHAEGKAKNGTLLRKVVLRNKETGEIKIETRTDVLEKVNRIPHEAIWTDEKLQRRLDEAAPGWKIVDSRHSLVSGNIKMKVSSPVGNEYIVPRSPSQWYPGTFNDVVEKRRIKEANKNKYSYNDDEIRKLFSEKYEGWKVTNPRIVLERGTDGRRNRLKIEVLSPNGYTYVIDRNPSDWEKYNLTRDPKHCYEEENKLIENWLHSMGRNIVKIYEKLPEELKVGKRHLRSPVFLVRDEKSKTEQLFERAKLLRNTKLAPYSPYGGRIIDEEKLSKLLKDRGYNVEEIYEISKEIPEKCEVIEPTIFMESYWSSSVTCFTRFYFPDEDFYEDINTEVLLKKKEQTPFYGLKLHKFKLFLKSHGAEIVEYLDSRRFVILQENGYKRTSTEHVIRGNPSLLHLVPEYIQQELDDNLLREFFDNSPNATLLDCHAGPRYSHQIKFLLNDIEFLLPRSRFVSLIKGGLKNMDEWLKYKESRKPMHEQLVLSILHSHGYEFTHSPNLIKGMNKHILSTRQAKLEIDLVWRELRLGIEVNEIGHYEKYRNMETKDGPNRIPMSLYHYEKFWTALNAGYFIFFVWEKSLNTDPNGYFDTYIAPIVDYALRLKYSENIPVESNDYLVLLYRKFVDLIQFDDYAYKYDPNNLSSWKSSPKSHLPSLIRDLADKYQIKPL